jgi:hypothetical protein
MSSWLSLGDVVEALMRAIRPQAGGAAHGQSQDEQKSGGASEALS